jgi:EmrB/QacA subfamily drug resistance transporter
MTPEQIHARRWWTLAVLCFSLLIIGMDNTILNVALPTIQRDLHTSASQLQWIVDIYTLIYASILLTTGSLGDRFGRKGVLSAGLVVFGLGSVGAAFSQTTAQLIAFRAVAGIGGAMIMPATLSILTNVFPAEERGRAIGIWAGVSGIGIVAGPLAGGFLLEHFFWGSVFLINIPIVIVALFAGHLLVPTSRDAHPRRLDPAGTVMAMVGLAALLYGIIEAPSQGWSAPAVVIAFGAGVAAIAAFVVWELRIDHPMLEIRFFRNPRFSAASLAITLVFFAMFGAMYFLTQYLQFVLGYSTMQAGAALIPMAAGLMVAAPNTARLTGRFGTKAVVAVGFALVAVAALMLSRLTVSSGYPVLGLATAILGVGMGTAMAPATDSIMGAVPRDKAGIGSAMNDTTRQIGGALGVAILGSITNSAYRSSVGGSAAVRALPVPVQSAVHDSVGSALAATKAMAGSASSLATQVTAVADHAFVHAMSNTLVIASGIALLGALVALVYLPARAAADAVAPVVDLPVQRRRPTPHGTWVRSSNGQWALLREDLPETALAG